MGLAYRIVQASRKFIFAEEKLTSRSSFDPWLDHGACWFKILILVK